MNERIHRDSMDESVIYSSVVDLCGQRRVRERREHHSVSSLRASRETGRESRESRVFSLRFSCRAASRENRASFRCDLVVVPRVARIARLFVAI
jgi:hypothetical protein